MNQRIEFALRALQEENHSALCREYGISRKTGYKWIERYKARGASAMDDQSRRPGSHSQQLSESVICEIIKLKNAHAKWGPKKIRELYRRKHPHSELPSLSSFKRILERAGLTVKRKPRSTPSTARLASEFKAQAPNDIWTIDFKGWWLGHANQRVEPLTIRDEFSRKILAIDLLPNTRTEAVKASFHRLFSGHGLPKAIRSDNGSPFANSRSLLGLTRLSAWWISHGIEPIRGRPGCPQDNGSHERMHLDIMRELQAEGIGHDQHAFDIWREEYNSERPHEHLDMATPDERYTPSPRPYDPDQPSLVYPGLQTRKVHNNGCISDNRVSYFLSNALNGHRLGIRYHNTHQRQVFFAGQLLGTLELSTLSFDGLRPQTIEAGNRTKNLTP